jgi:hypothetical protein
MLEPRIDKTAPAPRDAEAYFQHVLDAAAFYTEGPLPDPAELNLAAEMFDLAADRIGDHLDLWSQARYRSAHSRLYAIERGMTRSNPESARWHSQAIDSLREALEYGRLDDEGTLRASFELAEACLKINGNEDAKALLGRYGQLWTSQQRDRITRSLDLPTPHPQAQQPTQGDLVFPAATPADAAVLDAHLRHFGLAVRRFRPNGLPFAQTELGEYIVDGGVASAEPIRPTLLLYGVRSMTLVHVDGAPQTVPTSKRLATPQASVLQA